MAPSDSLPPHPGLIVYTEEPGGNIQVRSVDEVAADSQFYYTDAEDRETLDPARATQRIPIVEVRLLFLDNGGRAVPREQAHTLYIDEYGPDQQKLRSTIMIRDPQ